MLVPSPVCLKEVGSLGQDAQRSRRELEDCTRLHHECAARGPCRLSKLRSCVQHELLGLFWLTELFPLVASTFCLDSQRDEQEVQHPIDLLER